MLHTSASAMHRALARLSPLRPCGLLERHSRPLSDMSNLPISSVQTCPRETSPAAAFESDPLSLSARPPIFPSSSPSQAPADGPVAPGADCEGASSQAEGLASQASCHPCSGDSRGPPSTPLSLELMGSYNKKRLSLISQLIHLYLPSQAPANGEPAADCSIEEQGAIPIPAEVYPDGVEDVVGQVQQACSAGYVRGLQEDDGAARENVLAPQASRAASPGPCQPAALLKRRSSAQGRLMGLVAWVWARVA